MYYLWLDSSVGRKAVEASKTPKKASGFITQLVVAPNQHQGDRGSFPFEAWMFKGFSFCNDFCYNKRTMCYL